MLCASDEQAADEKIRPLVLFGEPVAERAPRKRTSGTTLYRRIAGFEEDDMWNLFASEPATRHVAPASLRRFVVDLKAGGAASSI